ncbi:hypothetical protein FYJ80_08960 [Spirochaetales bacterium NM-380-WT-3C1]|uniref:Uncharacterized protein n=1 Tax=Bullifex porci TaxID=2606638 RepID=A0A7X2PDK4_9SPIO|nr:hypothetical protein [Bullifex porci]MSU06899.1 hypothetical protein [Bullifex porci]
MKKTIAILLVAVLAVSSVFAGFSGKATVGLGYNWETKDYGFSNGTGFDVDVDLSTAEAGNDVEGDIYAGIKATMGVKVANQAGTKGTEVWNSKDKADKNYGLGLFLKVAEAYVAGENWKVSITGTQGATSYAKSFTTHKEAVEDVFGNETTDTKDVADDVTGDLFAFNKAPGVTVEVAGFKGSVGFNGSEDENRKVKVDTATEKVEAELDADKKFVAGKFFNYNVFVESPSFDVNGLSLQAAVGASRKVDSYGVFGKETKKIKYFNVEEEYIVYTPKFYDLAINTSAKVGYATDTLSVAVAADYDAVKYLKDDNTIYSFFDTSAKVAFAPVTIDAYYGLNGIVAKGLEAAPSKLKTLAHTLSAQVATDLAAFDLPVKVTVWGKDILNTMDYGAKAEVTIDAIKLGVKGGYVIDPILAKKIADENFGKYYLGADVEYTNDLFTAKAGVGFNSYVAKGLEKAAQLTLSASVESSAIIPGATLKLAYGAAKNDQNLLKDQIALQPAQNLGKVDATCTIKF